MKTKFPRRESLSGVDRRALLGMSLGLPFVAGCSSDPHSDMPQVEDMLGRSLGVLSGGPAVTREQAAAIPYASIGVRIGNSSQILLVLATRERDSCLWTSASHIALETQSGRIVRTGGLPHNMAQTGPKQTDPLETHDAVKGGTCEYVLDLPDRSEFGMVIRYTMQPAVRGEIVVLGAKLSVLHAVEHGACESLDWEFDNEYWLDAANGLVWRASQSVHPDLDPLEVTVLRPPA
jgi:Group 4 capsule polysaccharide lipoprotein gfcB, YjbF